MLINWRVGGEAKGKGSRWGDQLKWQSARLACERQWDQCPHPPILLSTEAFQSSNLQKETSRNQTLQTLPRERTRQDSDGSTGSYIYYQRMTCVLLQNSWVISRDMPNSSFFPSVSSCTWPQGGPMPRSAGQGRVNKASAFLSGAETECPK